VNGAFDEDVSNGPVCVHRTLTRTLFWSVGRQRVAICIGRQPSSESKLLIWIKPDSSIDVIM
jgi:hypothetical protein